MRRYRIIVCISLILLVPLGLAAKYYQGMFQGWVNNSFSSLFYEMFWIGLVIGINPRLSPIWVSFWIFITTSALEFLQLWNPPILAAIRATLLGRLVLGTTFVWTDFIYYLMGCTVSWLLLRSLKSACIKSESGCSNIEN